MQRWPEARRRLYGTAIFGPVGTIIVASGASVSIFGAPTLFICLIALVFVWTGSFGTLLGINVFAGRIRRLEGSFT
ncbi:hypothetical protein [Enterocloster clostridioformis]|uniref:hypothetical protein n=1 Tax=Enterocloster clostridioformis TaxID=1531 RepID=UPI000489E1BE|nr:hypothetical protein [Enterocloster clostridioformis]